MTDIEIINLLKANKPRAVEHMWIKYKKFEKIVVHIKSKGAELHDAEFCKDLAVTQVINYIKKDKLLYDTSEDCLAKLVMERAKLIWLKLYNENFKRGKAFQDSENIDLIHPSDKIEENRINAIIEIAHIKNKLNNISKTCQNILIKKYFEDKNLEEILPDFPKIKNLNSLKSRIWACITELRKHL